MSSPATQRISISIFLMMSFVQSAHADGSVQDQVKLMQSMRQEGKTGIARKTKGVDARPAKIDEVITTIIKGEGVETRSKPAENGDWVVRNRCPETGNEEILVKSAKFRQRYGEPRGPADANGYQPFNPKGSEMNYFIVPDAMGEFTFTAPWGEKMFAKPGDAIVQNPNDTSDTYRIAAKGFTCTYEIVKPAAN